ncbi:hypothetical protein VPAL9027_02673 [Vibrio palustris]|uniref:Outer membrane protein beta-barrel domain-containing protein n=2 Tax=Vibrio palustris TaxID=1918946 RepID=A0A1R4B6X6_9VIBR|nr:hypothetical protein VPAL9027_02673 [Vibrio palustris]
MMQKSTFIVATTLALCLPTTALANNFNYNYFEVRTTVSPQSSGVELSSYFTENSHFILRGDSRFSSDWDLAAGVGFNGPFGNFVDIYGQALIHQIRENGFSDSKDSTDIEISLGARAWLAPQVEGSLRLGKLAEHSIFIAGLRFHSTDQLSVGIESRNAGIWGPQLGLSVRFVY